MSLRDRLHDTQPDFHPLTPWNPLDQLRLLWWLFVNPARFVDYETWAGKEATRKVGVWLVSTLVWLPLFVAAMSNSLRLTHNNDMPSAIILFRVVATTIAIALAWRLTILSETTKKDWVKWMTYGMATFVACFAGVAGRSTLWLHLRLAAYLAQRMAWRRSGRLA